MDILKIFEVISTFREDKQSYFRFRVFLMPGVFLGAVFEMGPRHFPLGADSFIKPLLNITKFICMSPCPYKETYDKVKTEF